MSPRTLGSGTPLCWLSAASCDEYRQIRPRDITGRERLLETKGNYDFFFYEGEPWAVAAREFHRAEWINQKNKQVEVARLCGFDVHWVIGTERVAAEFREDLRPARVHHTPHRNPELFEFLLAPFVPPGGPTIGPR